jgi:hypothetical protein
MNNSDNRTATERRASDIMAGLVETASRGGVASYGLVSCTVPIPGGTVIWKIDGRTVARAEAHALITDGES